MKKAQRIKPKPVKGSIRLGNYLRLKMEEADLTVREAADKFGISYAYLSQIMMGKRVPEVSVCNAIADTLNEPRVTVLRHAGWLEEDDLTTQFAELEQRVKKDAQFREFVVLFLKLESKQEKELLLKMLNAVLTK